MYPHVEQQPPDEQAKPRMTRAWHWDQAEEYLRRAADSAEGEVASQVAYSEWCQRQALIHATLATK